MHIYLTLVKNSHFRDLWLSQITSQIALNMLYFVLAIRVYDMTGSNAAVSYMMLTFGIPAILCGVLAGGIVDHYDKRTILIFCNGMRFVLLFSFFFMPDNIAAFYVLSTFISIITQLFIPAEVPAISHLVHEKQLLAANSLFTISFSLSTLLGFIVAGPSIRLFGETNIFLFMGTLMLIATYFVSLLPRLRDHASQARLSFVAFQTLIIDSFRFILIRPRIRAGLILMTFSQSLLATLSVLAPGFSDRILHIALEDSSLFVMGPAALGLVLGAFFVGGIGSRLMKRKLILIGIFATGTSLLLLPIFSVYRNPLLLASSLLFFLGHFNSWISVPASTILQEDSSDEIRGRVYGVLTSLTGGVSILPVVFSGILADVIGIERTLLILGTVILGIGFVSYLKNRMVGGTIR